MSRIDFRFAPPRSWTAICLADDPSKSLVGESGELLYDFRSRTFESWRFERVIRFSAETASAPLRVAQRTESPRRGIAETVLEYPRQRLTLTAFGDRDDDGARRDVVLWRLECTDAAEADLPPLLTGLRAELFDPAADRLTTGASPSRLVRERPAGTVESLPIWPDDSIVVDAPEGKVRLVSSEPLLPTHAAGFLPAAAFATRLVTLRPGEAVAGSIVVPLEAEPPPADAEWAERALGRMRTYWDTLPIRRTAIDVPDEDVQAMVDAAARNILQAREIVDGVPQLQVGPAVYRGLWIVDGHFMMECARYLGLDDAADAAMQALLRRVRDDGSIVESVDVPHLKETAISLASFVREAELTGDATLLRERWPIVEAAVRFIDELRRRSEELPDDHPLHGVMPVAFADGGLAGERAELTTVLWTLAGLRYVADAAAVVAPERAHEHRARYEALRDAFLARVPQWTTETPGGLALEMRLPGSGDHHYAPGVADADVRRHRRIGPLTGNWAFCHAVWPGELFDPDDPLVRGLLWQLDRADDDEGVPAETGWLPYQAVWSYYASFAAHAWLYAHRGDKAADYLYAFANHAAPTRVWREEQSLAVSGHGQVCGDMPHNWASTEFIRLVLHLLVFESGPALELLPGLPPSWTGRVHVSDHPTRFGRVSLELTGTGGAGERDLDVSIVGPAWRPAERVTLRLPSGLTKAELEGVGVLEAHDGVVELPLGGRWRVRLRP